MLPIRERSVASSDKLLHKHAPIFIFSGGCRKCSTMVYRSGSQVFGYENDIVKRNMFGKVLFIGTVVAAAALISLLNITTPTTAGPLGVLAIFILSYIVAFGCTTFLIHGVSRIVASVTTGSVLRRPFHVIGMKHSYYFGSLVGLAPILLLGMQSVGGVGLYELLLVGVFVVIGCVYISKRIS
jgi:hypothetical protein